MKVKEISFEEICDIWSNYLWKDRKSKIESTSAMIYLGGLDISNMNHIPIFLAAVDEQDQITGVNSGHPCADGGFRSRGLYVFENQRGNGIGLLLLKETISAAQSLNANYIWSYPKQSSWKTYESAGFSLSSPWETSELGFNAYCIKQF